jgi:hypothetical protein
LVSFAGLKALKTSVHLPESTLEFARLSHTGSPKAGHQGVEKSGILGLIVRYIALLLSLVLVPEPTRLTGRGAGAAVGGRVEEAEATVGHLTLDTLPVGTKLSEVLILSSSFVPA